MKFLLVTLVLTGCVFGEDHFKGAGEACRADSECSTRACYGGICEAGSCDGGHDSECPSSYKCLHDDGDPIFGIGDGYYCARSCDGGCPERWECDGQDQTCYFLGPQVTVTADVTMPRASELVTFTATISPDVETTFTWHFEDLAGNPVGTTTMGETCEQTFAAGDYKVLVDWATTGYGASEGAVMHVDP
jgi:hypothetical protein